ncbi:MAG: protein-methionine-sulfoxide reductase heme-binding subunit MsrQ [Pseudomonadota bacterium]|nr:protein-methionine-sulfoxide reductase heme-binding subunit MsrQ [Pseudomonadota bacterium]
MMFAVAHQLPRIRAVLFVLALLPVVWLIWGFSQHQLGANPFEVLTRETGLWTLRLLLLTLLVRPLAEHLRQTSLLRLRRMLGLFSFFYACLHMLTYLWFDQFFDWQEIGTDILKRPYITLGMLAFLFLVPLALTSTRNMRRRLGRRWQTLHRLIYVIGVLGVVHFLLLVKADLREPLIYATLLAGLLAWRWFAARRRNPRTALAGG